ncbi:GMP synthetase [Desulfovibrionales bacterium]
MDLQNKVVILDYGSQVTQLIARRVREAGVYSEIHPCTINAHALEKLEPSALILSGGPARVTESGAPQLDQAVLAMQLPILGICYGMQLLAKYLCGELTLSQEREYGRAELEIIAKSPLWDGLMDKSPMVVWMSHGDHVRTPPPGFITIGRTRSIEIAAMADVKRRIYAVQFHPEVAHTENGDTIIRNFLFRIAGLKPTWTMASFIETAIHNAAEKVRGAQVVCGLSGGIDSTVTAVLLGKALGYRLHCIFVDNGLLRHGEAHEVIDYLRDHFDLNLYLVQAQDLFLSRLKDVKDPEEKRKIIGHTFIEIFEQEAKKINGVQFLAQGTLYPDVIESISFKGPSTVIKSHHNVGGLPKTMQLQLIEPLRELFKDEVRKVGLELCLPDFIIWRHPFPGPGLAIRIIGKITHERLQILRQADKIIQNELVAADWYRKVWQGFAVLLPLKTVGVMGDSRTYEYVIALRIVDSVNAMTADWSRVPSELLACISNRIINEVKGVNRVVYDISSKPPSTIEWE